MKIDLRFWLIIQQIIALCIAKRILGVFPHYGPSHFKVYYPLLHTLAKRGHNITVITYHRTMESYIFDEWLLKRATGEDTTISLNNLQPSRSWFTLFNEYISLHKEGQESCKTLFESGFIQRALDQHLIRPYDLIITEYFNSDCQLVLPYLMKLPIVGISTCLLMPWHYERLLLPDTPSYIQSEFIGYPEPLKWYQRVENFLQAKILPLLYRYYTNNCDNNLINSYFETLSLDVNTIAKRQTLIVLGNQHYSLMGIRPSTQKFIEVGGIHINEPFLKFDELPKYIEYFLETTTTTNQDVLFISWGSLIKFSTMPDNLVRNIINALHSLDMRIIWKWEDVGNIPTRSKNILFVKWAPQLQLLCHPKINVFWGHGGLLGTTEALYCGKPMLITPIYGDQFVNAYAVQNRKIGLILNYHDLYNTDNIVAILKNITQSGYKHRAEELAEIFRHRENYPMDTAVWWVEDVLKHKSSVETLHSYAVDLDWFVFYSLDTIIIITNVFCDEL
uniref:UDP-glucuronosyltransferase n=1 Tax=Glossina brevipalpis TaxID=37001 RepID=A0A1A9WKB9_9MUSC